MARYNGPARASSMYVYGSIGSWPMSTSSGPSVFAAGDSDDNPAARIARLEAELMRLKAKTDTQVVLEKGRAIALGGLK